MVHFVIKAIGGEHHARVRFFNNDEDLNAEMNSDSELEEITVRVVLRTDEWD